jgi:type IV pilus assembly protein PilQ
MSVKSIRFRTTPHNQERGTFEVSGFVYRPIGVILKVTPQVNGQGFIA